jgi:hypothetical protein
VGEGKQQQQQKKLPFQGCLSVSNEHQVNRKAALTNSNDFLNFLSKSI